MGAVVMLSVVFGRSTGWFIHGRTGTGKHYTLDGLLCPLPRVPLYELIHADGKIVASIKQVATYGRLLCIAAESKNGGNKPYARKNHATLSPGIRTFSIQC